MVQRSEKNAFADVAVDHVIEQTINRDSKTPGGIVGFNLWPSAVERWIVTAHERAAIAQACREVTGMDNCTCRHRESSVSAIRQQEGAVDSVVSLLKSLHNPFEGSDGLINIVSGIFASDDVHRDLLSAFEVGESALKSFMEERLAEGSTLGFYDTLPQAQLSTSSSMLKESSVKVDKAKMVLKADCGLFV